MFKQRLITALFLLAAFFVTLFYTSPRIFCLITEVIIAYAAWEWTLLIGLKNLSHRVTYVAVIIAMMQVVYFMSIPLTVCTDILGLAFIFWVLMIPLILMYPRAMFWKRSLVLQFIMGFFVLIPSWFAINFVLDADINGRYLLLYMFALVWTADISAYFFGSVWGIKTLVPRVSPQKTRAGVYGGVLTAVLATMLPLAYFHVPARIWPYALTLSLFTVIFSVVGDLLESMLKRSEGLKDSGNLLPGHGGLLDRIDSLTAAAPVFTFGAIILSRISS
jgi:phosphatidate cytidylyltransferase